MLSPLALLLLSAISAAPADSLRAVPRRGSPIRIVETAEPKNPRQVFLEAISGDSLWYRDDARGPLLANDCAALERMDVSRGQRGKSLVGAFVGGGAGLALGLIGASRNPSGGPFDYQTSIENAATPFLALAGGAVLGAIIGSQFRSHTWSPVAPPCASAPVRPIEPGDALRVYPKSGGPPVVGRLESASPGTLRLKLPDSATAREIDYETVEEIDRRWPGASRAPRRALIGGLIGGVAGLSAPWLTGGQPEQGQITALGGVIVGAVVGAAFGALTRLGTPKQTWRPIPIEQLKRMGMLD